jgi:hypothetical protein
LLAACKAHPRDTWQLRSYPEIEGRCWSPGDAWRSRSRPEPRDGSRSQGDTWRPRSCPSREPEPRGHAATPELPQDGRWEPGPWDTRARLVFYLDLELIRRGTRYSGCRQYPPRSSIASDQETTTLSTKESQQPAPVAAPIKVS